MSDYDPVEVTPLHADEVSRMEADAIAAIKAADSLDALKQARLAHAGDRSPIALANREIGALPPAARAEAGKRVGTARRAINEALAARQAELEAERDARVLVEETVDVTPAVGPAAARRPPPADHHAGAHRRRVRRHGLRSGRGPRLEGEWFNFDALNIAKDHPARSGTTRSTWQRRRRLRHGAAHADLAVQIRALLQRELPVYVISPGKTFRTDELDATPPRSSTRPRGWPWTRA